MSDNKQIIDQKVMYSFYNACEKFLEECAAKVSSTPNAPSNKPTPNNPNPNTPNPNTPNPNPNTPNPNTPNPNTPNPAEGKKITGVKSITLDLKQNIKPDKAIADEGENPYGKITMVVGTGNEKDFLFDKNEHIAESLLEEILRKAKDEKASETLTFAESGDFFTSGYITGTFQYTKDNTNFVNAGYNAKFLIKKEDTKNSSVIRITLSRKDDAQIKETIQLKMNEIVNNFNVVWNEG